MTTTESTTRECPFPGCEWSYDRDGDGYTDVLEADRRAHRHYEREHAGEVRIQVTLEKTQRLGDRDPAAIRERLLEGLSVPGYDVAHARTEVLEPADDHSVLAE